MAVGASRLLVVVAGLVPFLLACSGLPIPGGSGPDPAPVPDPDHPAEPKPDGAEPDPAPGQDPAEPAKPESLFTQLDPSEAPPYKGLSLQCPAGSMVIRNPSGGRMRVYCATTSGVRTGPYTEWQGSKLRAAGTNEDGKFAGRLTRWDSERKVGEEVYAAGVLDGDFATWDTSGHLLSRGRYTGGKKAGRFLENTGSGDAVKFGGACYDGGDEQWRTTDPVEFVTKPCG